MTLPNTTPAAKQSPVVLADGRHRCLLDTCKKAFTPKRSDQCYCKNQTRDCKTLVRKARRATVRAKKPYKIPLDAHQRYRILDAVRAAESVQILSSWRGDVDEAVETINILTATNTANLKNGKSTFHVCHVDAANHSYRMGLLSSQNLFIGLGTRNRATGAFSSGMGQSISRLTLSPKWSVHASESNAQVWSKIEEFVGLATLTEACRKAGFKPSAKTQALSNLGKLIDRANPDHAPFIKVLENPKSTTIELQMAVAEIQGKAVYDFKLKATSEQAILFGEIRRHAAFRPELEFLLTPINRMYSEFINEHGDSTVTMKGLLNSDHLQTLFLLLQGHDADDMKEEVEELAFGFNFAARKISDEAERYAELSARQDALYAYLALPPHERAVVYAQRKEEADLLSGLIYEEGDYLYRGGYTKVFNPFVIPGYEPF